MLRPDACVDECAPTAAHSNEDIDTTLDAFEATKKKLDAGGYKAIEIPDMADAAV